MAEKNNQQQPTEYDLQSTEEHRFYLAILFIGGFLVIMGLALLGQFFWGYTGIKDLAAIFSGWIVAIIGFYFAQQNTAQAHQQAMVVTKDAAEKKAKYASKSDLSITELEEKIEKQKEFINQLLSTLDDLSKKEGERT
jgi:hypothetical protein